MSHRRRLSRPPTLALAALLLTGCLGLPSGDSISQGELLLELTDAINGLRDQDALLQEQVDSLRNEVARQDSIIVRLAAATGVSR